MCVLYVQAYIQPVAFDDLQQGCVDFFMLLEETRSVCEFMTRVNARGDLRMTIQARAVMYVCMLVRRRGRAPCAADWAHTTDFPCIASELMLKRRKHV